MADDQRITVEGGQGIQVGGGNMQVNFYGDRRSGPGERNAYVAERDLAFDGPPELGDWVVDRPAELSQAVEALLGGEIGTVGITTELRGAGGFGKTTVARQVCAAPPVRQAFGNRIYFMTVGLELRSPVAVAAKVNDLIKVVSGENATFTDPELAGQRLAALLNAGARCLLILDDVWEPYQLAPFAAGTHSCARLVTTRNPQVLAGQGRTVVVDQMSADQARAVLAHQLPSLDRVMAGRLLRVTGREPAPL